MHGLMRESWSQKPALYSTHLFIDFSKNDEYEVVFDELLRTIFRSAINTKPPLGEAPTFREGHRDLPVTSVDLPEYALELLRIIARQYDSGQSTFWNPQRLIESGLTGRISMEAALSILEAKGYLELDHDGDYLLTSHGKKAAVDLRLV